MDTHHQQALDNTAQVSEFGRDAVPESGQKSENRNSAMLQHHNIVTPRWSDRVAYGNYGPLTQSGVFPHTTEYQLAYNRGPLSPMQTVYPRQWTYKPHWSTPAMLNTGTLQEFPMPDRLRFNLDFPSPEILPPVMPTLPSNLKDVESLVAAKADSTMPEWTIRDPYRVNLVDALKDDPTRKKVDTFRLCKEENQIADNRLADQKQKLGERVNDVNFWRREVVAESELLEQELRDVDRNKQNLDRIIADLEGPLKVSLDCTGVRRLKKGDNAVMYLDGVDYELSKEQGAINNARDSYRHMAGALQAQNGRNRVMLDTLYADSADKHTALSIDHKTYGMKFTSPEAHAYLGIEVYENTVSTPQSWAHNTNSMLLRSQKGRAESNRLRQESDQLVKRLTNELWQEWSRVNEALRVKINQMEDHSRQLHQRYTILNQEICDLIRDADLLKRNIEDKVNPIRLTQTRLQWRSNRPVDENCHDPAHTGLRQGLTELHNSVEHLAKQLRDVELTINNLHYTKTTLEHEIRGVAYAIHRDRDRCLAMREAFPVPFQPCLTA